ncbi:MAG: DUF362 domain-containing protein [bacterium]|nr:DUF362 domain-containing protein [bacterium]
MSQSLLFRALPRPDRSGGLGQKFKKLLSSAALERIVSRGDLVAVKMHFGEPGNVRYIRPIFPVMLVEALKDLGARPFVTDTAVLYKSPRHTAWEYYQIARRHGFTAEVLGCPLIIAGGMGDRSVSVNVPNALRLQTVGVAPEICDADVIVSLAHVTLHLQYPLGAALKNIGMGCVDIPTKLKMHESYGANPKPTGLWEATMDGARAILQGLNKKFFGINLLLDITPDCDCWDKTETPVVPDLGILAGTDPVALDRASYDLIVASVGYPGSKLEGSTGMVAGQDKVQPIYKKIEPEEYFEITANSGLGNADYRLEEV